VASLKFDVRWAVILVRRDNGVVCAHLEHVLARLRRSTVDGEGVVGAVNGAPFGEGELVRGLDLPVLNQVFDELGQGSGLVVRLFACRAVSMKFLFEKAPGVLGSEARMKRLDPEDRIRSRMMT
jgi:hypothetical protein